MPKKFDPKNKDVLLSPGRQERLDVQRVISLLPMGPHHVVADIGCGPGYFAVPLGKYLFQGKVFAIDVQEEMLEATKEALKRIHLTNVEVLLSEESKFPMQDGDLDGAFAAFVVHEAEDPSGMLAELERCLRPGGWLALLEWHKREMDSGPPLEERIEEADLLEMAQKAGFRLERRHSLNSDQYMLVMRR
jgi:ubiquinone/menaquinone biosynthesis C-methylase UbiE